MKLLIVLCLFSVTYAYVLNPEVELPDELKVCSRYDIARDECLKDAIQTLLPSLHKGIPNIELPSFDPFVIDNTEYGFKSNQYAGSIHIKNSKTYGLSRGIVNNVKSEITDNELNLEISFTWPRVFIEGNYAGKGIINDITLSSKGYFNISMGNIETTMKMHGSLVELEGEKYMKIDKFDSAPKVGKMKVYAEGLLPDPELNRVALEFVNQNWNFMYNQMLPFVKVQWEPILIKQANRIYTRVPFRRLISNSQ